MYDPAVNNGLMIETESVMNSSNAETGQFPLPIILLDTSCEAVIGNKNEVKVNVKKG